MRRKSIAVICIVALNLLLAATVSSGPVLDHILAKGELRVGTTGTQPPMTSLTKNGSIIGLDADIARGLAEAMGLKVIFVPMQFSKLLQALEERKVDLVLSGMTMTSKRNLKVAFVGPYYVSGKGILAKAQKYAALKEASGLNSSEVRIAALENSTSQDYSESLMPKATLIKTKSHDESIDLLFNEKADVVVADFPFCALSAFRYKEKKLIAGQSPLTYEPLGIAMKEDPLLINLVQNYLSRIKDDGQLEKMGKKWFEDGSWIDELK